MKDISMHLGLNRLFLASISVFLLGAVLGTILNSFMHLTLNSSIIYLATVFITLFAYILMLFVIITVPILPILAVIELIMCFKNHKQITQQQNGET